MTIKFRNTDSRWGAGSGAGGGGVLTSLQFDENNYEFQTRIETLEADGPREITGVTVSSDGTTITFNFSDSTSSDPIPLPIAMIHPRGEWQPSTLYDYLDLVNVRGTGVYLVLVQHTSDTEFDPEATDGSTDANPLYQLWAPLRDINYDIAFSIMGGIEGSTSRLLLGEYILPRSIVMDAGLAGAYAFLGVATAVEDLDLSIEKNGEEIGTITFSPGVNLQGTDGLGQFAAISFPSEISFDAGDRIAIRGPTSADADASDLSITLPATRTDL
jgi:hypothetical protein